MTPRMCKQSVCALACLAISCGSSSQGSSRDSQGVGPSSDTGRDVDAGAAAPVGENTPEPPDTPEGPVCGGYYGARNQAELEVLRNCREIGYLVVHGFENASLEPLTNLEIVRGLLIGSKGFKAFDSLEGLRSLRQASHIRVENTLISDLSGLNALEQLLPDENDPDLNGLLYLSDNSNLKSLAGLEKLEALGSLTLRYNNALTTLDDLNVPSELKDISLGRLELLESTAVLSKVRKIRSLEIKHLPSLSAIDGLAKLQELDRLAIGGNESLTRVSIAPGLARAQSVWIADNPQLPSFASLESLERLDSLNVSGNFILASLTFPLLAAADSVVITNNPNLESDAARALAAQTSAPAVKVARNQGEPELLSPCPWGSDGVCDELNGLNVCIEGSDPDCRCMFECFE